LDLNTIRRDPARAELEAAAPSLPSAESNQMVVCGRLPDGTELPGFKPGVETSLVERLSGCAKPRLREFIAFCRAAGFAIW